MSRSPYSRARCRSRPAHGPGKGGDRVFAVTIPAPHRVTLPMTDDEFLAAFETLTLDPRHFNHLGHVRLAWLYLQRHDVDEAVARTCAGIQAYATHLGAAGKFHRTITEALVRLLRAAGAADRSLPWDAFIAANATLVANARERLAVHYSDALLASAEARDRFVAPDRAPLPG